MGTVRYSHDQKWPEPQPWAYKPKPQGAGNDLASSDLASWVKEQSGDAWTGEATASLQWAAADKQEKDSFAIEAHVKRNACLLLAVLEGDIKRVQELLLQKADVETSVDKGATPYLLACASGAPLPMLSLLERHGANVLATDSSGATALILAAYKGNLQTVRHLLSRPDPAGKAGEGKQLLHARTRKGETVLMAAAKSGGPERAAVVAELLKAGADVSQRATGAGNVTALHVAAAHNATDVIEALLSGGADVGARTTDGSTPLLRAAATGAVGAMTALVAAGANPTHQADKRGYLALHVAAAAGHVDAVNILLDNTQFGLSVESPTTSAAGCAMMTPLACAAVAGQVEMISHLLSRNAHLESLAQGRTALGWAASAGKTAAVRALAAAGADLLAEDAVNGALPGLLARQLAEYHLHLETAEALSELARNEWLHPDKP